MQHGYMNPSSCECECKESEEAVYPVSKNFVRRLCRLICCNPRGVIDFFYPKENVPKAAQFEARLSVTRKSGFEDHLDNPAVRVSLLAKRIYYQNILLLNCDF